VEGKKEAKDGLRGAPFLSYSPSTEKMVIGLTSAGLFGGVMQRVNVWLCFCLGEFHLGRVQSDFHNRQQTVIRYDKAKVTPKSTITGVRKANQKLFPTKLGGLFHR
jgi:hypothetical protein